MRVENGVAGPPGPPSLAGGVTFIANAASSYGTTALVHMPRSRIARILVQMCPSPPAHDRT